MVADNTSMCNPIRYWYLLFGTWAIIKVLGHEHRWLASGYDLEIGHF